MHKQLLGRSAAAVSPCHILGTTQCDATEFGQHDWLTSHLPFLKPQHSPARTFELEEACFHFIDSIALHDAIRLVVIVVNADDVSRYALPSIVSDDGTCRVQGLSEMVK